MKQFEQPSRQAEGGKVVEHVPVLSCLSHVVVAVTVFFALLILFDARGLYFWSLKLAVSERTKALQNLTEGHWRMMSGLGLDEPKFSLERLFLDFQEAHPLLYPHKYREYAAKRKARRDRARDVAEGRVQKRWQATDTRKKNAGGPRAAGKHREGSPRVLIVGDSIMVSVGPIIKKDIQVRLDGESEVIARVATGLSRPDVFDWRRELDMALSEDPYDYVVMMMGTNDSQDFVDRGSILTYGTHEWVKAYNQRVAEMMATACSGARRAIWIGLPPMKSEAFNRKIIRINSWAKRQAQRSKCVEYLVMDQILGDERGQYTAYLKIGDQLEKIRNVDGIHVTTRGGELISQALLTRIVGGLSMAH